MKLLKGQEKILKEFGKYGETGTIDDFDDERKYGNGWWWYSKDPYTYDAECHTFHEDTLEELYKAIKREAKLNNWEEKYNSLQSRS